MRPQTRFVGILALSGLLSLGVGHAMASDFVVVDGGIPEPLTKQAGSAAEGKAAVVDRKLGNCLACHQVTDLKDMPFHGDVGPPLDGVADRWDEGQLRLILVNSKEIFPDTVMPAFYRKDGFHRVREQFQGKTILTAQQVEDVVAYLKTLKE